MTEDEEIEDLLNNHALPILAKQILKSSDKCKAYQKAYNKAYQKAYQKTDKYKAYNKAYQKAYQKTDKCKAYKKAYYLKQKHLGKEAKQ